MVIQLIGYPRLTVVTYRFLAARRRKEASRRKCDRAYRVQRLRPFAVHCYTRPGPLRPCMVVYQRELARYFSRVMTF
jgi:hypothetical protein